MSWIGYVGYLATGLLFGGISIMLLIAHPGGRRATWVIVAAGVTVAWALALVVLSAQQALTLPRIIALDVLQCLGWVAASVSLLSARREDGGRLPFTYWMAVLAALLAIGAMLTAPQAVGDQAGGVAYLCVLGTALIGMLTLEQVFRNSLDAQRASLRLLAIAVGSFFAVNLFVYTQALLLRGLAQMFWEGRGIVSVLAGPLILVGIKRYPGWQESLFVSRQVAFYTASLVAVGSYLLAMGAVAYVIHLVGGTWDIWLQTAFLAAALGLLVALIFSATIQSRLKVFLAKHFYRNKYDYRVEWRRLTETLGRNRTTEALNANGLEGIAAIIGSRDASLWMDDGDGRYQWTNSIGRPVWPVDDRASGDEVVSFLIRTNWVVDTDEYRMQPDRYGSAFGAVESMWLPAGVLVVPLDCQGDLLGFIVLGKPAGVTSLNFEDHDLLKMAGKQVAVVVAQSRAQDRLAETKQFQAMNKLSTFLMHDLKNVVNQQELMVANARKFKDSPEFIDDMIATIRSGSERMRRVLTQLNSNAKSASTKGRFELAQFGSTLADQCADRQPVPVIEPVRKQVRINADAATLSSVLTHLIRNAQDATPADGRVDVRFATQARSLSVEVSDTGSGMDADFVRTRLFRPFDSTKGAQGMGIGAYQARETIRAMGGDVAVESAPGRGTTFRLTIPDVVEAAPVGDRSAPAA